jgi:hypothetical protein
MISTDTLAVRIQIIILSVMTPCYVVDGYSVSE